MSQMTTSHFTLNTKIMFSYYIFVLLPNFIIATKVNTITIHYCGIITNIRELSILTDIISRLHICK